MIEWWSFCGDRVFVFLTQYFINPFLRSVFFWSLCKHQKTKGFLMFSGGLKGSLGNKSVKWQKPALYFTSLHCPVSRSSRPKVFCKEGVLRNFAKFIGKHLCQGLFYNKVTGPRRATLLKKRLLHRYFPVEFSKFLRIPFLKKHLQCLLLYFLCYIKFRTSIYFDFCGLLLDFFFKK